MIAHRGQRWLYLGIPKTATTALHDYLPTLGGEWISDRQHDMEVPEALRDYRVFATSLNPYRRAWSLWRMFQGDTAKGAKFTEGADPRVLENFRAFVEIMLLGPVTTVDLYHWSMSRWLEEVPEGVAVEVLPAERLNEELRRIGVIGPDEEVPVRNITKGNWLEAYAGPEGAVAADAVRRWAAEDFRRFGYPTRLSVWRWRAWRAALPDRRRRLPRTLLRRLSALRPWRGSDSR
ncbi:MAG: hypothetical protein JRH16_15395 [Deltaproteobacteria bacterium]|nr:hypothetical protein [Deltaproteobacteria bacterium]MBW2362077.1 hypothetical protein [Deltaproteobacteria bacterium]